jgi:mannonate dehydratase
VFTRRRVLLGLGAMACGAVGVRLGLPSLLRVDDPADLPDDLAAFVAERLRGLDLARVWDVHVHALGFQAAGNGCWVHPDLLSHGNPILRFQMDAYLAATGIDDPERADEQHVARLLDLQRRTNPAGRMVLLAFDWRVTEDGTEDPDRSVFHVPDRYVLDLAARHGPFEAAISVHPYRRDAAERIHAGADAGAVAIKWLPNAMGIDPASPLCDAFYRAAAETGLPLITHAGAELAVRSAWHEGGNPLRLRRALDHGVRVLVAHAGSTGTNLDLDAGGEDGPEASAFDLTMRLFDEYPAGSLGADVSSLTTINRSGTPLRTLLERVDLHDRLLYGSDYPITAIRPLVSTWLLHRRGYITADEADAIDAIRARNPLLADLVLHRCLAVEIDGVRRRFPAAVFETARHLHRPPPT